MNRHALIIAASLALLQGCGNRSETVSLNKRTIALSAFSDTQRPGTLDPGKLTDLPRIVSLKADLTPVKDQSDRATCSFFATIALVEASIKKHQQREVNLSEEFLSAVTKTEGFSKDKEESFSAFNLYSLTKAGLLLESDWPYRPSAFGKGFHCEAFSGNRRAAPPSCLFQLPPEAHVRERRIDAKALELESIPDDTNEFIRFIAQERRPLVVGVPVNFNGWESTGATRHTQSLHTECLNNPSNCGLHEILIYGYDLNRQVFFFKNSWGKSWGQDGHGEIEMSAVDRYSVKHATVSVRQKDPLLIPEELGQQKAALTSFAASAQEMVNGSIEVTVNGQVENTLGHVFYTSSGIGRVTNGEAAQDSNTEFLRLSPEEEEKFRDTFVRAIWIDNSEGKAEAISWNHHKASIPTELVSSDTAQRVLGAERSKVILRTTVFVHTDTEGFKQIKRVYHPLLETAP